jgi:hypothetical protein
MPPTRLATLAALLLAAGCAAAPPRATAPDLMTPAALRQTNTEPGRTAIGFTDAAFGRPERLRGRPDVAADAVGQLEWLTVALATDPRWTAMPGIVAGQFPPAREEVRATLGIRPDATTNEVIGAMDRTAAALRANDRDGALRALAPVTAADAAPRALSVLDALPRLPRAAQATSAAQNGLARMDGATRSR